MYIYTGNMYRIHKLVVILQKNIKNTLTFSFNKIFKKINNLKGYYIF